MFKKSNWFILFGIIFLVQATYANSATLSGATNQSKNDGGMNFSILYKKKSASTVVLPARYMNDLNSGSIANDDKKALTLLVKIEYQNIDLETRYVIVPLNEKSIATKEVNPLPKNLFENAKRISFPSNQKNDLAFIPLKKSGTLQVKIPVSSNLTKNGYIRIGVRKDATLNGFPRPCKGPKCTIKDLEIKLEKSIFSVVLNSSMPNDRSDLKIKIKISKNNTEYEVYDGYLNSLTAIPANALVPESKDKEPAERVYILKSVHDNQNKENITGKGTIIPKYNDLIQNHMSENGYLSGDEFQFSVQVRSPQFTQNNMTSSKIKKRRLINRKCKKIKVVNVNRTANIRNEPSLNSKLKVSYRKGTILTCIGLVRAENRNWYEIIRDNGEHGYISQNLTQTIE